MCIFKNKWKSFEPTTEYLSVVNGLTSVSKLYDYSKSKFIYIAEKKDYWETPIEFMSNGGGDCDGWARWYVDILVRIIKIDDARFVIHSGYDKARWGNKIWNVKCHAICVFEWQGKFGVFSNNELYIGIDSHEDAGKITFPDGLKYMEIRNSEGKAISRKFKLWGIF